VLGIAAMAAGHPGVTASLAVRYCQPSPLHDELTYTGHVNAIDGRKTTVQGSASASGVTTAEATATFVGPRARG
jgi:hypothetical protein